MIMSSHKKDRSNTPQPSYFEPGADRKLYVGNLDVRVSEATLLQLFSTVGEVVSIKIVRDKHSGSHNTNYGFVEFRDRRMAEAGLTQLAQQRVLGSEIRLNWAIQTHLTEENLEHFHIFVGDLGNDVTDKVLSRDGREARVMWDHNTNKSRGFGFVAYRDRSDAEKAISAMNGKSVGSRQIRCNWANQKQHDKSMHRKPLSFNGPSTFEGIAAQSPPFNTTVYVGNVSPTTTESQLVRLFEPFGYIVEIRIHADKGFAFVKLDTHENASVAILNLNGMQLNSRQCSWGRDRPPEQFFTGGYPYPPIPLYYPPGQDGESYEQFHVNPESVAMYRPLEPQLEQIGGIEERQWTEAENVAPPQEYYQPSA